MERPELLQTEQTINSPFPFYSVQLTRLLDGATHIGHQDIGILPTQLAVLHGSHLQTHLEFKNRVLLQLTYLNSQPTGAVTKAYQA